MDRLSKSRVKALPAWAAAVRRLRERLGLSQEGLARRLDLSLSEVRRWDQGKRGPAPHRAVALGKLAGPPDCWVFWELAGFTREDAARALGGALSPAGRRKRSKRWGEEAQEAAFSALELIFERAPSAVIEQTLEFLINRAGKYGEPE
jgi:transcriptional regulator with XRE-family HTH domain